MRAICTLLSNANISCVFIFTFFPLCPRSSFFAKAESDGLDEWTFCIGFGLFTYDYLKGGDHVAYFNGIITTDVVYKSLQVQGKGGYAIRLKEGFVLDCYENAKKGSCFASMSNCPRNVKKRKDGEFEFISVEANCEIFVNRKNNRVALRVKRNNNIQCMSELCWTYGNSYIIE